MKKNCKKVKNKALKFFIQSKKIHRKKKKNILSRKRNSNNIRKKKYRFLKCLKNEINKKLKKAGTKYIFCNLPYSFVCNLSKK